MFGCARKRQREREGGGGGGSETEDKQIFYKKKILISTKKIIKFLQFFLN